jgi:excisionase family DNA binding protein
VSELFNWEANDRHCIFSAEEMADYLRLPLSTVYKLVQDKKLPGFEVGRHWRFRKETVDYWLDERLVLTNKLA